MADTTNPYAKFLGDKEPYFVLRSTADRIQELTAGLTPKQLADPPSRASGRFIRSSRIWRIVELVFPTRARMIMFQNNPTLVSFDQDPWVLGWMRQERAMGRNTSGGSACFGIRFCVCF